MRIACTLPLDPPLKKIDFGSEVRVYEGLKYRESTVIYFKYFARSSFTKCSQKGWDILFTDIKRLRNCLVKLLAVLFKYESDSSNFFIVSITMELSL